MNIESVPSPAPAAFKRELSVTRAFVNIEGYNLEQQPSPSSKVNVIMQERPRRLSVDSAGTDLNIVSEIKERMLSVERTGAADLNIAGKERRLSVGIDLNDAGVDITGSTSSSQFQVDAK